jgi:hypothetical protein
MVLIFQQRLYPLWACSKFAQIKFSTGKILQQNELVDRLLGNKRIFWFWNFSVQTSNIVSSSTEY